jgi:chemotaxis protein MotA
MDLATILGVISSFALVFLAIAMGSNLKAFFDLPSAMIVLGGTMGATMINYPLADVIGVFRVGMKVLFARTLAAADLVATFVDYATRARREGIVTLDGELEELKDDFFRKGLQLTVDGLEPQAIDDILRT